MGTAETKDPEQRFEKKQQLGDPPQQFETFWDVSKTKMGSVGSNCKVDDAAAHPIALTLRRFLHFLRLRQLPGRALPICHRNDALLALCHGN
jgi:hypothetical protein